MKFTAEEVVDVQIKGARVVIHDGDALELTYAPEGGNAYALYLRQGSGVTVIRRAPAEWPPQPGDVWRDKGANAWFSQDTEGDPILRAQHSGWGGGDPERVLNQYGPMTLVYREGWTPAPAADADQADEPKLDQRAELIAGIREFADFLEAHPDLPADQYIVTAQHHVRNNVDSEEQAFDELRRIAAILDVEPELADEPNAGHPNATRQFRGIQYRAVYITDAYKRGYAEPADAQRCEDTDTADDELTDEFERIPCPAHGPHPHDGRVCLDCPACGAERKANERAATDPVEPDADGDLIADAPSGSGLAS